MSMDQYKLGHVRLALNKLINGLELENSDAQREVAFVLSSALWTVEKLEQVRKS